MVELKNEGYEIETVDIDTDQDRAVDKNIRSLPTTIIYKDEMEWERIIGPQTVEQLKYLMSE